MIEQLIATRVPTAAPRQGMREAQRLHTVTAADHLKALLETAGGGRIESSLLELALAAACDVETARRAAASLDPVDHVFSVDIQRVPAEEPWGLTWAPVTSIVDLMLDWDLLVLEISVVELSEWLSATSAVTVRAVDWLALTPGVRVVRQGVEHEATVQIAIALDRCPLTAEVRSVAG